MKNMNLGIINEEKEYNLIARVDNGEISNYVVAYRYDKASDSWAQGHYFDDVKDAVLFATISEMTSVVVNCIKDMANTEPDTTLSELADNDELELSVRDFLMEC